MNFRPVGERCILRRLEEEKKVGKIITLNVEPSQFFEVISVGENCNVNKGDIVLLKKYGFSTADIEGIEYAFVNNDDILAVKE